MQAAHMLA